MIAKVVTALLQSCEQEVMYVQCGGPMAGQQYSGVQLQPTLL